MERKKRLQTILIVQRYLEGQACTVLDNDALVWHVKQNYQVGNFFTQNYWE